jgi:hypothetical protein
MRARLLPTRALRRRPPTASAPPKDVAMLKGRVLPPADARPRPLDRYAPSPSRRPPTAQSAASHGAATAQGGRVPQAAATRPLTPEPARRRCPCRIPRQRTGVGGQQCRWWALEPPPSRPLGCSPSWRPPLVELAPSIHTVGDSGHPAGARDTGSGTTAYAVINVESMGDRGVRGARIEAIHSENSSGGQPCSVADAMDWIETKAI